MGAGFLEGRPWQGPWWTHESPQRGELPGASEELGKGSRGAGAWRVKGDEGEASRWACLLPLSPGYLSVGLKYPLIPLIFIQYF